MTVTNQNYQTIVPSTDGIQTDFTFDFPLANTDDIFVTLAGSDVSGLYEVLYTQGDQSGIVHFTPSTPSAGNELIMTRITPRTQDVIYPISGPFPSKSHEGAMDKLTMAMIELESTLTTIEEINTKPTQRTGSADIILAQTDAGKVVKYDGPGGHDLLFPASLEIDSAFTFKNIGSGIMNLVAPVGGLTWLSGIGLQTGDRIIAVGAIVTIQMNAVDIAEVWGNGTS